MRSLFLATGFGASCRRHMATRRLWRDPSVRGMGYLLCGYALCNVSKANWSIIPHIYRFYMVWWVDFQPSIYLWVVDDIALLALVLFIFPDLWSIYPGRQVWQAVYLQEIPGVENIPCGLLTILVYSEFLTYHSAIFYSYGKLSIEMDDLPIFAYNKWWCSIANC